MICSYSIFHVRWATFSRPLILFPSSYSLFFNFPTCWIPSPNENNRAIDVISFSPTLRLRKSRPLFAISSVLRCLSCIFIDRRQLLRCSCLSLINSVAPLNSHSSIPKFVNQCRSSITVGLYAFSWRLAYQPSHGMPILIVVGCAKKKKMISLCIGWSSEPRAIYYANQLKSGNFKQSIVILNLR